MKKQIILLLMLFVFHVNAFSRLSKELPKNYVVSKFQLANFEALNLDAKEYSKVTFKKNDCETGGYSFFSPFYLNENLAYTTYSLRIEEEDEIFISIKKGDDLLDYSIIFIDISEDKTEAKVNIKRKNLIFKSLLIGENLSKEGILKMFRPTSDQHLVQQEACPACVVIILAIIADTVSSICKNTQEQYRNCNASIEVGACSCIPK